MLVVIVERMARSLRTGNLNQFIQALHDYNGTPVDLVSTVDGSGLSLIHLAAEYANPAILELLLSMDVPATFVNLKESSMEQNTPLHLACAPRVDDELCAIQCVQLLLSKGADPNVLNGSYKPPSSRYPGVQLLLQQKRAITNSDLALDDDDPPSSPDDDC